MTTEIHTTARARFEEWAGLYAPHLPPDPVDDVLDITILDALSISQPWAWLIVATTTARLRRSTPIFRSEDNGHAPPHPRPAPPQEEAQHRPAPGRCRLTQGAAQEAPTHHHRASRANHIPPRTNAAAPPR